MRSFEVNGAVTVSVSISSPTDVIAVHARNFKKISGSIYNTTGPIRLLNGFPCYDLEYYVLHAAEILSAGSYSVNFTFAYDLRTDLRGFYRATYTALDSTERVVASTQFEPVDARSAFPCFDEPAMKATFSLTLAHDPSFLVVSNMPVKSSSFQGGLQYTSFESSPTMSTYLLAFAICDFGRRDALTVPLVNFSRPVNMAFYAPKDQINQVEYAVDTSVKILPYFEKFFGVEYPLPKADMIAIPDFAAGAMENWGLITYRMNALLYDPLHSSTSDKKLVAWAISHELAHQWFGNIVTMDWWSDLWLNEGFATYVGYLGIDAVHPQWKITDYILIADMAAALSLDALVTSRPIYIEVQSPEEIGELFDLISYSKGASVLRMLENAIGTNVFVSGLHLYLKKYLYGNARTEALWSSISEAAALAGAPFKVAQFMDTWTRQMGYPVIHIKRFANGTYSLDQSRFFSDPKPDLSKSKFNSTYRYKWVVPFNYLSVRSDGSSVGTTKRQWMNMSSTQIDGVARNYIIKGNAGHYGFYRVNYDDDGWRNIINVMKGNPSVFDVKDRTGLLADAFALAGASQLGYPVALEIFSLLSREREYLVWKAGVDGITVIPTTLTRTRPAMKYFKEFMLKTVNGVYDELGFVGDDDDYLRTLLRGTVLEVACANGHVKCLSKASDLFKAWIVDPVGNRIPGDLRELVYFYGILNGGKEEWEIMWQRYLSSQAVSEKEKLLFGLSAIQEPWMINRYLEYGLNESYVKSQDAALVFSHVANSNPIGRHYAWNYLVKNWDVIEKRFGGSIFIMRKIFDGIASGFSTEYDLKQVENFVRTIKNPGTGARIIMQVQEKIRARIEWVDLNEDLVESWLERNRS